jgi:hypothetical protein
MVMLNKHLKNNIIMTKEEEEKNLIVYHTKKHSFNSNEVQLRPKNICVFVSG